MSLTPDLSLYYVHDDPVGAYPEDRWPGLVWAENARDAALIAATYYDGGCPRHDLPWDKALASLRIELPEALREQYRPPWPTFERRADVLRLAGFSQDGEDYCDVCELYPMGIAAYALCPLCGICRECGCTCPTLNAQEVRDADHA